jgi:SMODS and SLOG-associating 2TM effector domain 1
MSDRAAQFHALYRELRIADQRSYYKERRQEYQFAHEQAVSVRNVLLVLSALAGVIGTAANGTGRALAGVVAAVLASLAGAVTAFEGLVGFSQLQKLYADAEDNLAEAEIDWDAAGPRGDIETIETLVDRVEGIFRTENGQWGQLTVENATKQGAEADPPPAGGSP